jgi:hypothetical protein
VIAASGVSDDRHGGARVIKKSLSKKIVALAELQRDDFSGEARERQ